MSNLSFQTFHTQTTITNSLTYPEGVNERIVKSISLGEFPGFLPIRVSQEKNNVTLTCVARDFLPLKSYLSRGATRCVFLQITGQIASLLCLCQQNNLNPNNLFLNMDALFVHPTTGQLFCIYWPLVNNALEQSPATFLATFPKEFYFPPSENLSFLYTYKAFFDSPNPFSANQYQEMIASLSKEAEPSQTAPQKKSPPRKKCQRSVRPSLPFGTEPSQTIACRTPISLTHPYFFCVANETSEKRIGSNLKSAKNFGG